MNQILNSDDTDLSAAAKYSKDQIDQFIAEHNVKTIETTVNIDKTTLN